MWVRSRRLGAVGGLMAALFLGALVLAAQPPSAWAVAPPNDNLSGRETPPIHESNFGTWHTAVLRDNVDATTQGGELVNCDGSPYGSTVWFAFNPPTASGTAVFHAAGAGGAFAGDGLDTVMSLSFLTGPSSLGVLGCNDDWFNSSAAGIGVFVERGDPPYIIQVGGYASAQGFFDYTVDFTPVTRLFADVFLVETIFRRFSRVGQLNVVTEPGARTRFVCKRKCGKVPRRRTLSGKRVNLRRLFKKNGFKARRGMVVELLVTNPRQVGYYERIRFRPPKPAARKKLCLDGTATYDPGTKILC